MADKEFKSFEELLSFTSRQSFLIGQISGMVHRTVDLPVEQLRESVDDIHNFLQGRVKELYYNKDK